MKKAIKLWATGAQWLFTDNLISFYVFISMIIIECAYLFAHPSSSNTALIVIIIAYVINLIFCAWQKGKYEACKKEKMVARLYVVIFLALFFIGCFVNLLMCIELTLIPLAITLICIIIRNYSINWLGEIIVVGVPYIAFVIAIIVLPISPVAKVLISICYFFVIPFFPILEDNTASCNIFEIAYNITWSKIYEDHLKRYDEDK